MQERSSNTPLLTTKELEVFNKTVFADWKSVSSSQEVIGSLKSELVNQ